MISTCPWLAFGLCLLSSDPVYVDHSPVWVRFLPRVLDLVTVGLTYLTSTWTAWLSFCFSLRWFWAKRLALFCLSIKQIKHFSALGSFLPDFWHHTLAKHGPSGGISPTISYGASGCYDGPSWRGFGEYESDWSALQQVNSNRFSALNQSLRHQRQPPPIYLMSLEWKMQVSLTFVDLLLFNMKFYFHSCHEVMH